ncbi:hypothetical protein Pmani_039174 [Petrolisthes manimaculis]|uniref:SCP domain-containing protein n=1 Tax=Petrolisthes manimaculis TaxID=1843537 RepID=A0AAE1TJQ7_9EUCA|nr:hypothetical protein Pmani_039174 [Petrolisthes manimaculis]
MVVEVVVMVLGMAKCHGKSVVSADLSLPTKMEPQNDLLDIDCQHMSVQPSTLDNTYDSKKGSDDNTLNNMKELVYKSFSQHNLTLEAQMILEGNLPCLCGSAHCHNLAEPQPQGGESFALINTCTQPEASHQNNDNTSEVNTAPLTSPYCSISSQHSLCLYNPQQHATNTCGKVYSLGVGETEKMEVLDVHNELRVKVAGGKEMRGSPTGPQPPAADMMMLEWDEELAAVAQAWVNQCVFKHDCNRCRSLERWSVGQNLYLSGGLRAEGQDWRRALTSFYDEVTMMNPSQVQAFRERCGPSNIPTGSWLFPLSCQHILLYQIPFTMYYPTPTVRY